RFLLPGSVASLFQVRLEASSGQAYFCAILSRRSDRGGANANWDDPGENIGARRPGGAAVDRKRIGGGATGAVRSGQGCPHKRDSLYGAWRDVLGRSPPRRQAGLARLLAEPRRFRTADGD